MIKLLKMLLDDLKIFINKLKNSFTTKINKKDNETMCENNEDLNKFKELYDLSLFIYKEELDRNRRLEEKAYKYLFYFSIIFGFLSFFSIWLFQNYSYPKNCFECFIIFIYCLLLTFAFVNLILLILVLKILSFNKIDMRNMIDFFYNNDLIDIYYSLSKMIIETNEKNIKKINLKLQYLKYIFFISLIFIILFFIFLILIGIDKILL